MSKWHCLICTLKKYLFMMALVFIALQGLSLIAGSGAALHCSTRASRFGVFSCCRAQSLGTWASVVVAHGP